MPSLPEYELFALRYAMRDAQRSDHFIGGDPHDGPMPMDYFLWVAVSSERTFVIDCGFTETEIYWRCVAFSHSCGFGR